MRFITILFIFSIFSCDYEKYEPVADTNPLAECIDGHARFELNGNEYEFECDGYDLMGYISLDEMNADSGNDSWGWTDPSTGKEYALMGLDNGTGIIDISIPTAPLYLGKIPTATEPSSWRDLKVFNNHVFIVSEAEGHGMQVFDLKQLRGLNSKKNFTADFTYTGYGQAHNIAINTETGYAYTAGSGVAGNGRPGFGIHALNIADPISPVLELQQSDFGYTHDAQIVNYKGPDSDHFGKEIYIGSNETKVVFVDVTDKNNPNLISEFEYDSQYTHQSWLTEDHRYALLGDELDEAVRKIDSDGNPFYDLKEGATSRTIAIDINDLDNPILHFNYISDNEAIDHNGYVNGSKFYLANYTSGLRVIDLINIEQKSFTEIGYFDTYSKDAGDHDHNFANTTSNSASDPGDHIGKKGADSPPFNGAWSVYPFFKSENIIISDINSGLFIVKKKVN